MMERGIVIELTFILISELIAMNADYDVDDENQGSSKISSASTSIDITEIDCSQKLQS